MIVTGLNPCTRKAKKTQNFVSGTATGKLQKHLEWRLSELEDDGGVIEGVHQVDMIGRLWSAAVDERSTAWIGDLQKQQTRMLDMDDVEDKQFKLHLELEREKLMHYLALCRMLQEGQDSLFSSIPNSSLQEDEDEEEDEQSDVDDPHPKQAEVEYQVRVPPSIQLKQEEVQELRLPSEVTVRLVPQVEQDLEIEESVDENNHYNPDGEFDKQKESDDKDSDNKESNDKYSTYSLSNSD